MPIPDPVRIFHITAAANLQEIARSGALLAKNAVAERGLQYSNIAYQGAQGARARRRVPDPPGGVVHDYVPFYFAPRSPMLMAIDNGKVEGCSWRQGDIVHLETTVKAVTATGAPFLFFDRNATLSYANPYTDLTDLDQVAWDLLTESPRLDGFCMYWFSTYRNERYVDRMERRQAEFLVKGSVPVGCFTRVGVMNAQMQRTVDSIFKIARLNLQVEVMPAWYF